MLWKKLQSNTRKKYFCVIWLENYIFESGNQQNVHLMSFEITISSAFAKFKVFKTIGNLELIFLVLILKAERQDTEDDLHFFRFLRLILLIWFPLILFLQLAEIHCLNILRIPVWRCHECVLFVKLTWNKEKDRLLHAEKFHIVCVEKQGLITVIFNQQ